MRTPFVRDFNAEDTAAAITDEATPAATAALLIDAILWAESLTTTPYCGTAHQFDALSEAALETRHLGLVTPAAAVHCRAALSRGWTVTPSATAAYHEITTSDGGTTGNDIVRVPWNYSLAYLPAGAFLGLYADIAVSSSTSKDAPTAPTDRLLEVQTLGAPYVEPWSVTKVAGFSAVVSEQLANMETL